MKKNCGLLEFSPGNPLNETADAGHSGMPFNLEGVWVESGVNVMGDTPSVVGVDTFLLGA